MMHWTCDGCDFRLGSIDPARLLDHVEETGHRDGRINFDPLVPDTEAGRRMVRFLAADLEKRIHKEYEKRL